MEQRHAIPRSTLQIPMPEREGGLRPGQTLWSPWKFGDAAIIDGQADLLMQVVGLEWDGPDNLMVRLSWLHNGDVHSALVAAWRLSRGDSE